MLTRVLFLVFCALLPSVASSQGAKIVDADGCIVGQPCAFGTPLPSPNRGAYQIDGDGCVVGDSCPWRGWRAAQNGGTTRIRVDPRSDNVYFTTRNPDGTTDGRNFNPRTGSTWSNHIDPGAGTQSGLDKSGRPWSAPLGIGPRRLTGLVAPNDEPSGVIEPDEPTTRAAPQLDSAPAGRPLSDVELQLLLEIERQREHQRAMQDVLRNMQPSALVGAARAASQQTCQAHTDASTRSACLTADAAK